MDSYTFKIADQPWEFEQIHSLNYQTFVEEIPQHASNPRHQLTDAFHDENAYLICVRHRQVLAMLAVRGKRPFSLDKKLDGLDGYLPQGRCLCEVRLLAAQPQVRNSRIVRGLFAETVGYCLGQGYDTALISGILEQVKLYKHLGFVPFGPIVGSGDARFQPMYLTIEAHTNSKTSFLKEESPANFLPGPIAISPSVRQALSGPELSHRSEAYLELHRKTQRRLCELTGAKQVQIFTGTGTLANDVLCGQLSLLPGRGLILSNGEFGRRLEKQAASYGLAFEPFAAPWGQPFDEEALRQKIAHTQDLSWIWTVHCESSTGMLTDIERLKTIARQAHLPLCLDCVSSIGNTPVNLQDVYLASACSSKGLRSVSGLALVFYSHPLTPPGKPLPVYLDLYTYETAGGVPFSIPSNLTAALAAALEECDFQQRFSQIAAADGWLRRRLASMGLVPLASGKTACPGIITCPLQKPLCSRIVGDRLREAGFLVSYESRYLLERNWIQFCLMSEISKPRLRTFVQKLQETVSAKC